MSVTVIPRDNTLAEQIADFFRRAVEEERYRQALEAGQGERRSNFAMQTAMLPTDVAASVDGAAWWTGRREETLRAGDR